jgi:hemerythrin
MMVSSQPLAENTLNCDRRYRSMIDQLDVMITFVRQQPGRDLTTELDRMQDVMQGHSDSANSCMALTGCPQESKHRLHHQVISTSTDELHYRFTMGLFVFPEELDTIRLLWLDHIHVHDQELEEFLAS